MILATDFICAQPHEISRGKILLADRSHFISFQVADALMKHATDKQFDENPPVPDNIAALAKEAEDEMKIDAKVMETGSAERR